MKKLVSIILALALVAMLAPAVADGAEPVQLKIVYSTSSVTLPREENPIRDAIREKTGIDILMEAWYYSSSDDLNTQLNIWAASGELPFDMLLCSGSTFVLNMVNLMGESGMLKNIKPYITASEPMSKFCAYTFPKYADKNDGNVYAYPYHLNRASDYGNLRDSGVSVRIDMLRELGLDNPANTQEFYELLVQLKEKYGIIPFSTANGDLRTLAINFVGQYGTSSWEKDENGVYRIVMFNNYDKLTDFAVFVNKLWNEGLMDQESFTQKSEQLVEKMANGNAVVTPTLRHSTQATINDILWAENPDNLLAFVPSFPNEGITPVNTGVNSWGGGALMINNAVSEEKMEAFMRYCEWLLTEEGTVMTFMGVEGVNWEYNADGKCEFLPEFVAKYPTENERQEYGLWHYQAPAASWFRIDRYAAPKPEYSRADYAYSMAGCNDTVEMGDVTYAVTAGEEEQLRLPSIDEAWQQNIVKAIMSASEADCRAVMDGFKATLDSLGYETVCNERTELTKAMAE